jgi:hypothetical protein
LQRSVTDTRGVAVAPPEADGVATHQGDLVGPDVRAHRAGIEGPLPRQLVDAQGARAGFPELLVRVDHPMAIRPGDVHLAPVHALDLQGRRVHVWFIIARGIR